MNNTQFIINGLNKGLPNHIDAIALEQIGQQGWNLLKQDLPLPLAVLQQSALQHNAEWMQQFLAKSNVKLAPHIKTTVSPQLIKLQQQHGAWAMTVATVQQLKVCKHFGIKRIIMANQLVAEGDINYVLQQLQHDAQFEFYVLVDSIELVKRLAVCAKQLNIGRPLNVLLEIGYNGGRTGCRNEKIAMRVANEIKSNEPYLAFSGIECYEGLLVSQDIANDIKAVNAFLEKVINIAKDCAEKKLFSQTNVLLTAGGSAYFDLVASGLAAVKLENYSAQLIVRSGCYLVHDSGFYQRLLTAIQMREKNWDWQKNGELQAALQVWSYVQSVPEPNLAILTMGKRDASYDIDLPKPLYWYRPQVHDKPQQADSSSHIFAMNDQHAYLRFSDDMSVKVGDMIACGISHPCTTFDKWQWLPVIDDDYNVIDAVKTFIS